MPIVPMSAVTGELPVADDDWQFEPKWDGMRAIVQVDHGALRAWSRTGRDITAEFPELAGMATIAPSAVIDGEVVVLGEDGNASFGRLQRRFGVSDPTQVAARMSTVPAFFVAFDLLGVDGIDAMPLPLRQRRALLERLVPEGPHWRVTPAGAGNGALWLDAAREQGLEGIMAKRLDSAYEPGRRSAAWRKIKLRHAQEFVVCGWTPGTGARDRSDALGALVLGCGVQSDRRWVGNVGTGFSQADLRWWRAELESIEVAEAPFATPTQPAPTHPALRGARWVRPLHVVQVAFAEWTADRRLRQPSLLGRRPDVDPDVIRCEE